MSRLSTACQQGRVPLVQAARTVTSMLSEELPAWALYHDARHTRQTVAACREIGRALALTPREVSVVMLAAWFHDTGYIAGAEGHEIRSAAVAERFLASNGCPRSLVQRIRGCILATRMPQRPHSTLQRVLCDADLIALGKKTFFSQNELLRQEMQRRTGRKIDQLIWLHRSYRFLHGHRFATSYGRTVLESGKQENLRRLRRAIEGMEKSRRR